MAMLETLDEVKVDESHFCHRRNFRANIKVLASVWAFVKVFSFSGSLLNLHFTLISVQEPILQLVKRWPSNWNVSKPSIHSSTLKASSTR